MVGRLAVAAELVETAVQQAESTQQLPSIASAKARRALVWAHRGDLEAAEREAAEAFAMAEGFDIPIILGYAATALAATALDKGDLQRVDEVVSRATAALDATGDVDQAAHRFHGDHLEALVGLGQLDRARSLADRLRRRGELGPRPTWSGIAARGEAGIAVAEGRLEDASEHMDRALAFHASGAVPLEHGRTLLAAAGLERRRGRRKAAAARLTSALEIFDRIGAAGWAGRARGRAVAPVGRQDGAARAHAERGADCHARLGGHAQPGDRRAARDQREDRRGGPEPRLRKAPDPVAGADRDGPATTRYIGIPLLP